MDNEVKLNVEKIKLEQRQTISQRYKRITKTVNKEFWDCENEVFRSLYVGSYGRGTAISTSDIDIMVILPEEEYQRYDYMKGNGQSRLLQAVKNAILDTYSQSKVCENG